jgi:hypothetical protein
MIVLPLWQLTAQYIYTSRASAVESHLSLWQELLLIWNMTAKEVVDEMQKCWRLLHTKQLF